MCRPEFIEVVELGRQGSAALRVIAEQALDAERDVVEATGGCGC